MTLFLKDLAGVRWHVKAETDGTLITTDEDTPAPLFTDDFDGSPAYVLWDEATGATVAGQYRLDGKSIYTEAASGGGPYSATGWPFTQNLGKQLGLDATTVKVAFTVTFGAIADEDTHSDRVMGTSSSFLTYPHLDTYGNPEHARYGLVSFWNDDTCLGVIDHQGKVYDDPGTYYGLLYFLVGGYSLDGAGGNDSFPAGSHDIEVTFSSLPDGTGSVTMKVDGDDYLTSEGSFIEETINTSLPVNRVRFGPPFPPTFSADTPKNDINNVAITTLTDVGGVRLKDPFGTEWLITAEDGALATTDIFSAVGYPLWPSRRIPVDVVGGGVWAIIVGSDGVLSTEDYVAGDPFSAPLEGVRDVATTLVVDLADFTLEAGEPDAAGWTGSAWVRFDTRASRPGTLVLTDSAGDHLIEVYDGSGFDDLHLLYRGTGGPVTVAFSQTAWMRIVGIDEATVDYLFTERIPELVVTVLDDLPVAPGLLLVTVSNMTPGIRAVLSVEGSDGLGGFFTLLADTTGAATGVSIPIPIELPAGAYVLLVATDDGMDGEATFIVLASPDVRPDPVGSDTLPADPGLVNVWSIIDPATDVVWTFPYNPSSMSTPHAPKPYDFETTTAPDGAVLTWEGAADPVPWSVRGYLDTEATYQALEDFVSTNRRYVVVDHRGRGWVVIFEDIDPTYHKSVGNDWSFDYDLKMLILKGPVTL